MVGSSSSYSSSLPARGRAPADVESRVSVKALEHPTFAYSYDIVDNRKGNGDGRVHFAPK